MAKSPKSPQKFELLAFGFALALVLLVEYLGYRSGEAQVETASSVAHTQQVIGELDDVLIATRDAETGRRVLALTGNESLLATYRDATTRARSHLLELRRLVTDHPEQLACLAALEPRVATRLRFVDEALTGQEPTGDERKGDPADPRPAIEEMRLIRDGIAEMVGTERRLLAVREQRTTGIVRQSQNAQIAGGALSVFLLTLVVVRFWRAIRAREASEAQARKNEDDLETTLESIGDGVIATDADGLVTRMNPVARAVTGWELASAVGTPIQQVFHLVHDVTEKDFAHPVHEALQSNRVVEIDDAVLLISKDGTKRRVSDSAAPIRGPDGVVHGVVLVFRDITKALEDARYLRRTRAFLDSIVENIPDMLFVKDARDLAYVRLNRAGEAVIGLKREEMIGKTDFAFFPPDQAKAFVDKDRETLRGKRVVEIQEEPLATSRGMRWLNTRKVPILDEDGEPEYLLGISADITDRRRADVALRTSMDATETAHRELESFSYSVAHDLRAPLRSIDGFSLALLEDHASQLDEEGKGHLTRVRNAARRMAELIDDLLALAHVSRADLTRSVIDLSALAREVGEQARTDRNPRAELVVGGGLTVFADPKLVRVLLENLLSNAFKFSTKREGARVEVGARIENGGQVFFVKDNGAGFDLAGAKKLFTAFQRYHRPSEYEGTGIGLAIADRIVSRHGGRIWAESTPSGGATFHFVLDTAARPR